MSEEKMNAENANTATEADNNSEGFTQEEMNRVAASEYRKGESKGQRDTISKLGFESIEDAQKAFEDFKEWKESQKSEVEKLTEKIDAMTIEAKNKDKENRTLRAEKSAYKLGVLPESLEDAVTLARSMRDDEGNPLAIDDALEKVLEKYPNFKGVAQKQVPKWSQGHSTVPNNVSMSKEEIMAVKDMAERQRLIKENLELFI